MRPRVAILGLQAGAEGSHFSLCLPVPFRNMRENIFYLAVESQTSM